MWHYRDAPVQILEPLCFGFIYKITFPDKTYYIGKKQKEIKKKLPPLKGKKRKRVKTIENWHDYCSSSKRVKAKLDAGEKAYFEIIEMCYSKRELTYKEVWWQFKYDVLADPLSLNDNISGKFFSNKVDS